VLHPREASDQGVVEFNQKLYAPTQFFTTLLPIRDGVTVAYRLSKPL
jgi:hypothetical protein